MDQGSQANYDTIESSRVGRVGQPSSIALIRLDRARYRNAQSRALLRELDHALMGAAADPEVRAIVVGSTGADFSSGHDLRTAQERDDVTTPPMPADLAGREAWAWEHWTEPLMRWRRIPKPTIAAVGGNCLWGGWSLAAAMDLRVCAADAAILPHLSEFFALPWIIGTRAAREALFLNRVISADEAFRLGMVSAVCPAGEDVTLAAVAMAEEMAEVPPQFLRAIKTTLVGIEDMQGFDASVSLANSQHLISEWAHTDPAAQGVAGTDDSTSLVASALAKWRASQE